MSRDHFVPRLLLKRFREEGESLWYYDKTRPGKGVEARNPDTVFYSINMNSSSDGEFEIERQFNERIETPFNLLLDKIIPRVLIGLPIDLTNEERALCCSFVYYQCTRRPEIVEEILDEDRFGKIRYEDDFERESVALTKSLLGSEKQEDKDFLHDVRLGVISHASDEVIEAMFKSGIFFLKSPPDGAFCITSNPVYFGTVNVIDPSENQCQAPCIALPVSKKVAICFGAPWLDGTIQSFSNHLDIEQFNRDLWQQSNKIAGATQKQLQRIVGLI